MKMTRFLPIRIAYDDPPVVVPPPEPKVFKQEDVDRMVADARRKDQAEIQKHSAELKKLQNTVGLSEKEKAEIRQRLQDMEDTYKTAEQKKSEEIARKEAEYTEKLDSTSKERDTWKETFQKTTVENALVKHVAADAVNPDQLEDLLTNKCRVVADVDADGKPTGKHTVMVKITVTDTKTKLPVVLDVTVPEAVKAMKADIPRYGNLFKSTMSSGTGTNPSRNATPTGPISGEEIGKMTDEEYIAFRKSKNLGRKH